MSAVLNITSVIIKDFIYDNVPMLSNIKNGMIKLAECDADFCGNNGDNYLKDEAKKAGYKTNAEYYADLNVKKLGNTKYETNNIANAIKNYINDWMGNDPYYVDTQVSIKIEGTTMFVALAYTSKA